MSTARDLRRAAWCLPLFILSLWAPKATAAEGIGHEFIPPEHWSYPALARFEALGLCRLPAERLFSRDDIAGYTDQIAGRVAERGATLSPRDQFNLERLQREFSRAESRANPKARFDPPLLYGSDGPVHAEADLDLALVPDKPADRDEWDFFGVTNPALRLHLGSSLTYEGRYRLVMGPETEERARDEHPSPRERSWRGLTSLYERSYLVYHWNQGLLFFGRDYADWGPADNRNVILSQEAGSLDKLGGRLQFKNFRFSGVHAILSSPGDRYLSGHRLEGAFGRVTVGLSETVIHRDRFLDPVYMLPFSSFYANQFNERTDDNVMWAVDVKYRVLDGATVDGSLLVDDFQYERGDSTPDMLAVNVGVRTDIARPVPLTLRLRYRYVDIYTYTHRDSLKAHVAGDGDPNAGDPLLGVAEGPDTDLFTASADCFPLPRLTATLLFSLLRRGEGDDFRAFHPGDDHAPPFPSGVVERTTSFGLAFAWEFDGNSLARAELVRSRVENEGHVPGADDRRTAAHIVLRWNL
jgi:hypothetical protein